MANDGANALGGATAAAPGACGNNPAGSTKGGCGGADAGVAEPLHGIGDEPPARATPVGPVITVAKPYVLVHKPYIPDAKAVRTKVHLTTDAHFDGTGTLTVTAGADSEADLAFYDAEHNGNLVFEGDSNSFSGDALTIGIDLWAQGVSPSTALNDVQLELSLSGGTKPVKPPVQGRLTSVEVTLGLCQSRAALGADPAPLCDDDKINTGRFVHKQKAQHHGRALLIVRKAQPADFPGTLVLRQDNAKVRIFSDEVPAAGQTAIALPHNLPNGGIPAAGQKFWVEGFDVSKALCDTGFKLGVQGLTRDNGDWVRMTVVEFRNLQATVPATAPLTVRGNVPAVHHFKVSPAHQFEEDFTKNTPLVLIENSILDAKLVNLSVQIEPAGVPVPVFWKAQRAQPTGNAVPLDHPGVIALSENGKPSVHTYTLTATLKADAVGSFYIHTYVDCNGTDEFERDTPAGVRIDREPYAVMNLVLAHVEFAGDCSRTYPANFTGSPDGHGGIHVYSGDFNIRKRYKNAINMAAKIIVVGGGPKGKLGVNRVYAGWVQNLSSMEVVGTFVNPGKPPRYSRHVVVSNRGAGPFYGGARAANLKLPLLDVSTADPYRDPQGTGGLTATGSPTRSWRKDRTHDPGQFFWVELVDCPSLPQRGWHLDDFQAELTRYQHWLDFRVALCVWTGTWRASATAANRLYSVVWEYTWKMRAEWNITPPGAAHPKGAVAPVKAPSIRISNELYHLPSAGPVEGEDIEVRFPIALESLSTDYTVPF